MVPVDLKIGALSKIGLLKRYPLPKFECFRPHMFCGRSGSKKIVALSKVGLLKQYPTQKKLVHFAPHMFCGTSGSKKIGARIKEGLLK